MFGFKRRSFSGSGDTPASVWHKLIPGAAISLQLALESLLSAAFGSEACAGRTEGVLRTVAFALAWLVGLHSMKWEFGSETHLSASQRASRKLQHAVVNIGVVTCWLFAVSHFPLVCWVGGHHSKAISAVQGMMVAFVQVIVSFELFEIDVTGDENEDDITTEATRLVS